jgi:hypothetical protein
MRETAVVKRTDEIVTFIKDGIEVAASLSDWVATWKQPKVTAIPSGLFRLAFTFSQRFQRETIQALNVPGFTGIRVHAGNESKDTEGCVLPGLEFQGGMVLQSKPAVARWEAEAHQALKNATDVWLDVRNQA